VGLRFPGPLKAALAEELAILSEHWVQMATDASRRAPQEACGLVAGRNRLTSQVYPIANELNSGVRFRMDPGEQLRALLEIEDSGDELLAIYHSHPQGPDRPSLTDIAEAAYPGVVHLIWYPRSDTWECKGYLIEDRDVFPVAIQVMRFSERH
jgi:proteasome lid subunit RPN8/RPN11